VNFWGVLHGLQTFVPVMLAHGEDGYIVVNTASMAGVTPGAGPYTTTKHAVVSLSEGLYQHLKMVQGKVGTSVLCPGWVRTNLLDSERNRPLGDRPSDDREVDPREEGVRAWVEQQVANGMAPEQVAEIVLQGIREERFWITTTDEFDLVIRSRVNHLLARTNPDAPSIV
jgi:NAD(P)-dependent dehydrogenase (short-subunit alcohol dehydrogenase family)